MNKFRLNMVMSLLCILLLCVGKAAFALTNDRVQKFTVDDLEITAIADLVFPVDEATGKKLIPDIVKHPEYLSLFSRGPLQGITQVFFFRDGERNVLVDSGWGRDLDNKGELVQILKMEGIQPSDITDIIITHMDFDHIGGLLQEGKAVFPKAQLWISAPEYEAWKNGNISKRPDFAVNLAREVIVAYKDRLKIFNYGEEILPGVTAIDAKGHTPGHTAFQIKSSDNALLIVGDLMHLAQVQLPLPELNSVYDMDPVKAADSRKRILERVAQSKDIFSGMHFPMISNVLKRDGQGYMMREGR